MDLLQLISELEDLIDDGNSIPFSKKVMVDASEMTEILNQMRNSIPEEIKQAQWTNSEKDRILSEAERESKSILENARKESDQIINQGKDQVQSMIDQHEITKKAEEYGEQIVSKAEQNARLLKSQSINYVDEMLLTTQEKLKELLEVLEENRSELREN